MFAYGQFSSLVLPADPLPRKREPSRTTCGTPVDGEPVRSTERRQAMDTHGARINASGGRRRFRGSAPGKAPRFRGSTPGKAPRFRGSTPGKAPRFRGSTPRGDSPAASKHPACVLPGDAPGPAAGDLTPLAPVGTDAEAALLDRGRGAARPAHLRKASASATCHSCRDVLCRRPAGERTLVGRAPRGRCRGHTWSGRILLVRARRDRDRLPPGG